MSFKEMRKANTPISDLQKIIDLHVNLPHVQIKRARNGALYLTGLFDGVPDDVQNQDHESYEEINKLLGWIEGAINFPAQSKSLVPTSLKEVLDLHEHDESEVMPSDSRFNPPSKTFDLSIRGQVCTVSPSEVTNHISKEKIRVDEILKLKFDLSKDDDMTHVEDLKSDSVLETEKDNVQLVLHDESKEFSDFSACQVFDEISNAQNCHELKMSIADGISFDPGGEWKAVDFEILNSFQFSEYAALIDLMTKVFGVEASEHYFQGLQRSNTCVKEAADYDRLLDVLVKAGLIEKAADLVVDLIGKSELEQAPSTWLNFLICEYIVGVGCKFNDSPLLVCTKMRLIFDPGGNFSSYVSRFHVDDYAGFLRSITPETQQEQLGQLERFNIGKDCLVFGGLYPFCQT